MGCCRKSTLSKAKGLRVTNNDFPKVPRGNYIHFRTQEVGAVVKVTRRPRRSEIVKVTLMFLDNTTHAIPASHFYTQWTKTKLPASLTQQSSY